MTIKNTCRAWAGLGEADGLAGFEGVPAFALPPAQAAKSPPTARAATAC
jgi:hypothetical protein